MSTHRTASGGAGQAGEEDAAGAGSRRVGDGLGRGLGLPLGAGLFDGTGVGEGGGESGRDNVFGPGDAFLPRAGDVPENVVCCGR